MVTNWKPHLEIWFYTENYLRFTSDNYDPNNLHNKYSNLTNATINKENIKEDKFESEDEEDKTNLKMKIVENMYTNYQFEAYLNQKCKGIAANPFKDKIVP